MDFLLFGNVFVAICAVAQALYTYSFFNIKPDVWVCCFLFFSTLAYYNFCLLISKLPNNLQLQNQRLNWFLTYFNLNFGVTVLSSLVLIPLFLMLNYETKTLVIILVVLSAGYNLQLRSLNFKTISLRSVKGLKLFLIAFVWALSVVLLPLLQADFFIPKREITLLITKQFLLFVAITIPFDVRDFIEDEASNLKTLPIMYGVKKAYVFAIILLLVNILLVLCFNNSLTDSRFFASVFTPILAVFVILKSGLRKNPYYYFLCLDGILIVQYLFLVVINILK